MIAAPIPADDTARLAELHATGLLGTPDEYALDCVTRIAANLFAVPVCLISLVDAERQWFKSCIGLDVRETSRDISFCGHVVAKDQALIVEDALRDIRFADNPLVISQPHIRFYAGHPIRSASGAVFGTLCLVDFKPRKFADEHRRYLQELAFLAEQSMLAHQMSASRNALITKLSVARRESMIDPLLRIWNRGGIDAILSKQHENSIISDAPYSILMVDVDHFKQINDRHGHMAGDEVLRTVVRTLQSTLRAGDELGRYGGDEFLIVLPDVSADSAAFLARRLNEAVAAQSIRTPSGEIIRCTISIGIAECTFSGRESTADLIHRADVALLASKKDGRNRAGVNQRSGSAQFLLRT